MSFSSPTALQTTNGDVSVAVGDVNGDGRVDLVSASATSFRVLIGNGGGTFQSAITRGSLISYINNNAIVKLADVNHDEKVDVVVFSGGYAGVIPNVSGLINVFLGNGDGTFQASIETMVSVAGMSMGFSVTDLNDDHFPDVVVFDRILMGNGDGTFQSEVPFTGGGTHVLAADFNGDEVPDLVGLYPKNGSTLLTELRYSEGNGDGTFKAFVVHSLTGGFLERDTCAVTGDFNDDGKADVAYSYTGFSATYSGIRVMLGTGTGSFQSPMQTTATTPYGVTQFCAADFDSDGKSDVFVGNQGNSMPVVTWAGTFSNGLLDTTHPLSVLRSVGNGSFSSRGTLAIAKLGFMRMEAADLNKDGRPDIVMAGSVAGTTSLYTLLNTTRPNPVVSVIGNRIVSTTNRKLTIKGTAKDTKGELDRVEVKVGGAAYAPAKGTKKWTFLSRLRSGKNTFLVRAVDVSGVASPVARVTAFRR